MSSSYVSVPTSKWTRAKGRKPERNYRHKRLGGAPGDSTALDVMPLTMGAPLPADEDASAPPPPRESWKKRDLLRCTLWTGRIVILILAIALPAALALSILAYVESTKTRSEADKVVVPNPVCPTPQDSSIAVGLLYINETSLIDSVTLQQLKLVQATGSVESCPVWVSKQDELWLIDFQRSIVYIYQTLTWDFVDAFSLGSGCGYPREADYSPDAGAEQRGQVWIACQTTDSWVVYDPESRNRLAKIEVSAPYAVVWDPFDVVVGRDAAVVSLQNSTGPGSGILIKYSTADFTVQSSFAGLGPAPRLWYEGRANSFLFATSQNAAELYKIDFESLALQYTAPVPNAGGVTTDPFERFVYAVSKETTNGTDVIYGFYAVDLSDLDNSPFSSSIGDACDVIVDLEGVHMFVTHPNASGIDGATLSVYHVDGVTGEPTEFDTIVTGPGDSCMERFRPACPCAICTQWQ